LGGPLAPEPSSVEDGRQVDAAGWHVIETHGHQCCLRDDAEPLVQAPAEQLSVPRRHQEARPKKGWCHPNQGLQVIIALGNGVVEPPDTGRVSGDSPLTLDHMGHTLLDGVEEIAPSMVSVDPQAELIAGGEIFRACWPDVIAREAEGERRALHRGERLARVKAELRIERERAVVPGDLHQADARKAPFGGAVHHGLHELPPKRAIHHGRINRDRANAGDHRALVQEVAADDLAIQLSDHGVEPWMREQHGGHAGGDLHGGKVRREVMLISNGLEGLVEDSAALLGIVNGAWSKANWHDHSSYLWTVGPHHLTPRAQ